MRMRANRRIRIKKRITFRATKLIANEFNKVGIRYRYVARMGLPDQVIAGLRVQHGPTIAVRYFVDSNDNDVNVQVNGVVQQVGEAKRMGMLELCNKLNLTNPHMKFELDDHDNVNVSYDYPLHINDCIGPVAVQRYIRLERVVNEAYPLLMETLHPNEEN